MKRTVIGLVEDVWIGGRKFRARTDTGAERSSIDKNVAKRLGLGPVIKNARVKSAHGRSVRPVIKTLVKIKSRKINATFSLADRKHMSYKVLIGRNILKRGFLIDATK